MKTLLLLRHAKSDWGDSSLRDFDRPLSSRGERDAPRIGKALRKRAVEPDFILSSPAARARATVQAVKQAAKLDAEISFDDSVYGASSSELMKIIRSLPIESACTLMVGHNPGFEDVVDRLTGEHQRMPTAALACIEFDLDQWNNVENGRGRLVWLLTPKQLDSSC